MLGDAAVARLRRQRRRLRQFSLAGWVLVIAALAAFGVRSNTLKGLQKTGIKTNATVVFTDTTYTRGVNYPHIDVRFIDLNAREDVANIPVGESAKYRVGQTVRIAYSRTNPTNAVFAHGYADLGPLAAIFFFVLVCGVTSGLMWLPFSRRITRGLKLVKHHSPTLTSVNYQPARNRAQGTLSLQTQAGQRLVMRGINAKVGWPEGETPARVFGEVGDRKLVVIATPNRVNVGRLRHPR